MTDSNTANIAFIGAGNMANAIIGGLIGNKYPPEKIWAADPMQANLDRLNATWNIQTNTDNASVIAQADIVILAVKPQIMQHVCDQIKSSIQACRPLIISIAAGVTLDALQHYLGEQLAIVRCMPNTPSLCRLGATGLFANAEVSAKQLKQSEQVIASIGIFKWVDEEALLDAVTAVSGSGPAYFFRVMELMQQMGVEQGLSPDLSKALTLQTALGAAQMAIESDVDVSELRRRVTSPNGTTEAALNKFEEHGIEKMFQEALQAANDRSKNLADELNKH